MKNLINIILIVCFSIVLASIVPAVAEIDIGSSREEVIKTFGPPSGQLKSADEEILTYPGGLITIKNGVVSYLDDDFISRLENRKLPDTFKTGKNSKGLVEYNGQWITPGEKAELEQQSTIKKVKKSMDTQPILVFSAGGQAINLDNVLVEGKVTIVDFYADWCGPCRAISPALEQIASSDPAVYLRKIDIVKWGTPVTQQYKINSIPHIRVYGKNGKMIGSSTLDINTIKKYISQGK